MCSFQEFYGLVMPAQEVANRNSPPTGAKRVGRPRTKRSITELIVRLARENRTWGYGSIEGALLNLGHDVGRSTIARVLKKAGIEPAPQRKKGMTWSEFLRSHWNVLAVGVKCNWGQVSGFWIRACALAAALASFGSCWQRSANCFTAQLTVR